MLGHSGKLLRTVVYKAKKASKGRSQSAERAALKLTTVQRSGFGSMKGMDRMQTAHGGHMMQVLMNQTIRTLLSCLASACLAWHWQINGALMNQCLCLGLPPTCLSLTCEAPYTG